MEASVPIIVIKRKPGLLIKPLKLVQKMCSHTLWSKSLFMIKETVIYALTQSGDLLVAKNGSSV